MFCGCSRCGVSKLEATRAWRSTARLGAEDQGQCRRAAAAPSFGDEFYTGTGGCCQWQCIECWLSSRQPAGTVVIQLDGLVTHFSGFGWIDWLGRRYVLSHVADLHSFAAASWQMRPSQSLWALCWGRSPEALNISRTVHCLSHPCLFGAHAASQGYIAALATRE